MNATGSVMLGLSLVALALLPLRADTLALASNPGNPYAAIPERNVFGLLPIPVPVPVDPETLKDPPPKITPNGIMNLFGQLQVMFKVTPKPTPGQPTKDLSYVLAEGERQDDITVMKIDVEKSIITFNNHGKTQELPLAEAAKGSGGSVPTPAGAVAAAPKGVPTPGNGTALSAAAAARLANAAKAAGTAEKAGEAPTVGADAAASNSRIYNPTAEAASVPKSSLGSDVTPEEAVALKYLEAKAKNDPTAALFPLSDAKKKEVDGLIPAGN